MDKGRKRGAPAPHRGSSQIQLNEVEYHVP